ncbi:LacI family transcriptional regulator [Kribbella orskensis]|uniref:LacI family transcriptional regulator n=1 Tax=Kribbella orskensis TaxID=2512216 RepID=A0ABY2BY18_9ACTN|nr:MULTISPECIES: LacI family DNA-binding transcriptional regulator [Kribbella]TCN44404.1 LacI family transcriptional regulator [Kribbella sp. VKM Ac-2500]TCO31818.1 LacI family transcriptional regulator [Kribbella orskensis]
MGRAYRVRDIAVQAGLSETTVDRVLNGRAGVSVRAQRQVEQAIRDLDRQQSQVRLGGRTFVIDLVMQAPARFSSAVRSALEGELPGLRPAIIRARFALDETASAPAMVETLDRVRRRGSQGVILKAPDEPEVVEAVDLLVAAGIPVVTLVTDLPTSRRAAYVGIDNRAAGATAAYFISQWLGDAPGNILVTLSRDTFRGEEEREMGFRATLRRLAPQRSLVELNNTDGLDTTMHGLALAALSADPTLNAVYSIGGGNRAIVEAFTSLNRPYRCFVAHDLDPDNHALLRTGALTLVLHHDLPTDLRRACQALLQSHHLLPNAPHSLPSNIHPITPHNLPNRTHHDRVE